MIYLVLLIAIFIAPLPTIGAVIGFSTFGLTGAIIGALVGIGLS